MSQAKVETLKIVFGLAYADGQLADTEEKLINFLIDSYGLTPEEEKEVRTQAAAPPAPEHLAEVVKDDADRAKAYEVAALVSLMDGSQQSEESEMLRRIRDALGIAQEQALEIEGRARGIYARFAQHQAGDPSPEE